MIITVIYGTGRREQSSTYNIAQTVIKNLKENDKMYEFFLPKDMDHFCRGCYSCFSGHEERCGGYEKLKPIKEAMDKSELIIFTIPVYVFHAPGQLKAFLDHFGYRWIVHSPNPKMFKKQALLISTAAGAGTRSAVKDVKDSMDFWGIGRVHCFRHAIWSADWGEVSEKNKKKMHKKIIKICKSIKKHEGKIKSRLKVKAIFYFIRFMHNKFGADSPDKRYWKSNGWLDKKRPWK